MASRLDTPASAASSTLSFAVSAGTNRRLIVGCQAEGSQTGNHTCDYGGQTGRLIAQEIAGSGTTQQTVSLFEFTDAQIQAASNTTIAIGNAAGDITVHAASYQNCSQSDSTNADTDTSDTTPNPLAACDVTTTGPDSVVVSMGGMGNTGTASWAAPLSEQTDQSAGSSAGSLADGEIASATTVACELTWSNQNRAAIVAVELPNGAGVASVDSDYGDASDEFDVDEDSLDVNGSGFEASQGSGTVYLAEASTLAASTSEVDVGAAVQTWSDSAINLDLTALTTEQVALEALMSGDGHSLYVIVVNDSSDEFSLPVTVHRAKAFALAASTHITASGEDTTAQLTAPAGKTTGDFGGGRVQDDENPSDSVDPGADEYMEHEWCLEALDGSVIGETYQFRVLVDGEVAGTISVIPEWTIGSAGVSASESIDFGSAVDLGGRGELAGSGGVALSESATLEATGELAASTSVAFSQAAQVEAFGELSAIGSVSFGQFGALAGLGELVASTSVALSETASLGATVPIASTVSIDWSESALPSATGALSAPIVAIFSESVALVGTTSLAGSESVSFSESGSVVGSGALATSESVAFSQAGLVVGRGALSSDASVAFSEVAALEGAGELVASAGVDWSLDGFLATGMRGSAAVDFSGFASLSALGELVASSSVAWSESVALSVTGELAAIGSVAWALSATLEGAGEISAIASVAWSESATAVGTGALAAAGEVALIDGTALAGLGALAASESFDWSSSAVLAGGAISASTSVAFEVFGILAHGLAASESVVWGGSAALGATGELSGSTSVALEVSGLILTGLGADVSVEFSESALIRATASVAGSVSIDLATAGQVAGAAPIVAGSSLAWGETAQLRTKRRASASAVVILAASASAAGTGRLGAISALSCSAVPSLRGRASIGGAYHLAFALSGFSIDGNAATAIRRYYRGTPSSRLRKAVATSRRVWFRRLTK